MLNISEAFGAQQLIGDVGRRIANKTAGRDANGGDFRRPLLGKCQSFLDNVLAQFGDIRARNYRSGAVDRTASGSF
jgi:hypothetical protein